MRVQILRPFESGNPLTKVRGEVVDIESSLALGMAASNKCTILDEQGPRMMTIASAAALVGPVASAPEVAEEVTDEGKPAAGG